MSTSAAAPPAADLAEELSRWLVGAGIIAMALFPLAIPAVVLTAVLAAPLVLLGLGAALPAGIVAGIALGIRAMSRRLGSRLAPRRPHSPLSRPRAPRPSTPRLTRQIGR